MIELLLFMLLGFYLVSLLEFCISNYPLAILYFRLKRHRWQMRKQIKSIKKEMELELEMSRKESEFYRRKVEKGD